MAYSVNPKEITKKLEAAFKLLEAGTTTRDKFESARKLITGLNPRIDSLLTTLSAQLSQIEKLQKGEVIELTAEHLPETTAEEEKRKHRILIFIKTWKDLKGEVTRVQKELDVQKQTEKIQSNPENWLKIISHAKGPFGAITITAVVIVAGAALLRAQNANKNSSVVTALPTQAAMPTTSVLKIQAIKVGEKTVALSELITGQGPECLTGAKETVHYHAKDHNASHTTDGSLISDPGGCGYGKVEEVEIVFVGE